jgi:predicted permease
MHLYTDLQQRFAALPGVVAVTYSDEALIAGGYSAAKVHLDGAPPKMNINPDLLSVGPGYFSAMRIPLSSGRAFNSADFASTQETNAAVEASNRPPTKGASGVRESSGPALAKPAAAPVPVIINELFARKFFPNQSPIGMHIGDWAGDGAPSGLRPGFRIVGIAGDTKYRDLKRDIRPTMYTPLVDSHAYFALRVTGDSTAVANSVRKLVAGSDSRLPIFEMRTQAQQIAQTHFQERLLSRLSSFFAVLATVLACIGLYGLLSYEVTTRTRELGIRMALGAQKRDLLKLVFHHGVLLSLIGAVLGAGAAFAVTRFMTKMLYQVKPSDPETFLSAAGLLILIALVACGVPALRAIRVDPLVALRSE